MHILLSLLTIFCVKSSYFTHGMHIFHIIPVLSLLLVARASHVNTWEPIPHPLEARDTVTFDVCANINADLIIPIQGSDVVDAGLISGSNFISKVMP